MCVNCKYCTLILLYGVRKRIKPFKPFKPFTGLDRYTEYIMCI